MKLNWVYVPHTSAKKHLKSKANDSLQTAYRLNGVYKPVLSNFVSRQSQKIRSVYQKCFNSFYWPSHTIFTLPGLIIIDSRGRKFRKYDNLDHSIGELYKYNTWRQLVLHWWNKKIQFLIKFIIYSCMIYNMYKYIVKTTCISITRHWENDTPK